MDLNDLDLNNLTLNDLLNHIVKTLDEHYPRSGYVINSLSGREGGNGEVDLFVTVSDRNSGASKEFTLEDWEMQLESYANGLRAIEAFILLIKENIDERWLFAPWRPAAAPPE
jgi:hypothetical protein